MKVSELAHIPDAYQRFTQSQRFIRELENTLRAAITVRDDALLTLRAEGKSQQDLGDAIGTSRQWIATMERQAAERMSKDEDLANL